MESSICPSTADDVLDLLDASFHAAALGAALELGLFWSLAERPLSAGQLARTLAIPVKRCHYWLQLLRQARLIEEEGGTYRPSRAARASILETYSRETWHLLAEEARGRLPGLCDLSHTLREPGSAWAALGLEPRRYVAEMYADPELARRFTRMLYELHRPLAEALAAVLDLTGVERLLDLGGGSGVMSLALLQRHPHLQATVLDLANVCRAGREIAAEVSLTDRISYLPTDFLRDELPAGYDLALESDVGVYDEGLFRKVRHALRPGGRFVVVDELAPAENIAPRSRLHWAFEGSMIDPVFAFPTLDKLATQLEQAGFSILSVHSLPVRSDGCRRFDTGLTVIEAKRDREASPAGKR